MRFGRGLAACVAASIVGCAVPAVPPVPADGLVAVSYARIPGWSADRLAETLPALHAQCHRLETLPAETSLGGMGQVADSGGKAGLWLAACQAAGGVAAGDEAGARRFYEHWFSAWRVGAPGLFTGYYEPEVRGSLVQGGAFQTPVLARPTDLLVNTQATVGTASSGRLDGGRLVPYWSRAEIEQGRIGAASRPLLWLADPVDLFFMQIQGAGRVRLPDGSLVRVGYDGKNGRDYLPIGRILVAQGALKPEAVTMQSIRGWLAAHPTQAQAVMDRNEDYVFFRVLAGSDTQAGPPGALGVDLQPGRSAAVDRHSVALGTPVFADTTDPVSGQAWRRLLLAQDVGSDIRGAARTDVFLGAGAMAERQAGAMHQPGTLYVLLPLQAAR